MASRERGVKRKQEDVQATPEAPDATNKKAKTVTGAAGTHAHRTGNEFYTAMLHTRSEQLKLPENKVFVASRSDKVVDVFKGLLEHNFASVPVLTKSGKKYWGFLDLADIVNFFVTELKSDELRKPSANFIKEIETRDDIKSKTVADICKWPLTRENPFHPVRAGFSLLYTLEALAKVPHLRRLAVVDSERRIVNLITQSMMVDLLSKNLTLLGDKVNKQVVEMKQCFKGVTSIKDTDEAYTAFKLMSDRNLSGVAVVDKDGKLVETFTLKDLQGIGKDGSMFWRLYKPAKEYAGLLTKDWESIRPRHLQTCQGTDTLGKIIHQLLENKVHRVWIVDGAHKPLGVISLRDILYDILTE